MAGAAIGLTALEASAAYFALELLTDSEWEVQLRGEAGDVPTTVGDVDIRDIVITGSATFVSHDPTGSIFFGKTLGVFNTIIDPKTFRVGGIDFDATTAFSSTSILPLGRFTMSNDFGALSLGGLGQYTANPGFFQPAIVISNGYPGTQLGHVDPIAEPGLTPLLALVLTMGALERTRRRTCPGAC